MDKLNNKVAIIGGGLTGLVAASELQKKGYKNVTIFEKEERLGGKLHTIYYNGRSYELGAIFGLPSQIYLKSLMKELHIKTDGPKLSRINYDSNGHKIMPIPKVALGDFLKELDRLPKVLAHYPSLDDIFIHDIEVSLMLPFSEWCDLHNFNVLKTIYIQYFTIFGLGDINEVPALYVLRILNDKNLMSFMELPEFLTWKDGVSSLIKYLIEEIKDIRFGQKVTNIFLSKNENLWVQTPFETLEFDQIIITAPLEQYDHLSIMGEGMMEHLSVIKYQSFNVYAIIGKNVPRGCGCILENLYNYKNGHMILWDSRWDVSNGEEMIIVYAYSPLNNSKESNFEIIKKDLLKLGVCNPRLYQAKLWHHCPYVDTRELQDGFYNKMAAIQGKNNIFFAGEIMSTLSMNNCICYAKHLIKRYF
ncbi:FAD-dependent oxidoreductase [Anaeromonas frigoriresistens]|nr:FAD-dependent oxidoreductase [Anaeromonas frigoriresistens]